MKEHLIMSSASVVIGAVTIKHSGTNSIALFIHIHSSSERENLLSGTGVPVSVTSDLENIEAEFTKVVLPFIQNHPEKFR